MPSPDEIRETAKRMIIGIEAIRSAIVMAKNDSRTRAVNLAVVAEHEGGGGDLKARFEIEEFLHDIDLLASCLVSQDEDLEIREQADAAITHQIRYGKIEDLLRNAGIEAQVFAALGWLDQDRSLEDALSEIKRLAAPSRSVTHER